MAAPQDFALRPLRPLLGVLRVRVLCLRVCAGVGVGAGGAADADRAAAGSRRGERERDREAGARAKAARALARSHPLSSALFWAQPNAVADGDNDDGGDGSDDEGDTDSDMEEGEGGADENEAENRGEGEGSLRAPRPFRLTSARAVAAGLGGEGVEHPLRLLRAHDRARERERYKAGNRRSMHARARPGLAENDRAPLRHSHPAPSRVASAGASGSSDGGGGGGAGGGGDPRLLLTGPLFGTPLPLPPALALAHARGGDVLASDDS